MRKFIGRTRELAALEHHYRTGRFEMVVLYGRRRLGKTMLLKQFAKGKRCLFFTALEKSDAINLGVFAEAIGEAFQIPGIAFSSWLDALWFVAQHAEDIEEPLLVIFDEFPYAAKANPSLPSMLQQLIDHSLIDKEMTLVLCGSNQGFMESEVLGKKSPLYGRRTAQMKLAPFDAFDARLMLGDIDAVSACAYYATFGGTPYYLSQIRPEETYEENISRLFFDPYGLLFDEPPMLLRQEFRETAIYTSILDAIASGATKAGEIADKVGISDTSCTPYLKTLKDLMIIERRTPFGESALRSRRGIYRIRDPFHAFWYRFVSPYTTAVEMGSGELIAAQTASSPALETYMGDRFEDISLQWIARMNAAGRLGFAAATFGKWWGTDPVAKEQADVDVVAADMDRSHMLVGECKWRNSFDETEALRLLERRAAIFAGSAEVTYALFTKRKVSDGTVRKAKDREDLLLVDAERMFSA
ncbi:MAG: ATP-binding protein [Atopobiaceae bacterium]|nr:ATP-binding protein [Atopobiaceae bacterium]